jgi:hypothetical protein
MTIPAGPWTAPSAAVYAADGDLVCTLGTAEVVKAYRKRGDTNGAMIAEAVRFIAAAPKMYAKLEKIAGWLEANAKIHEDYAVKVSKFQSIKDASLRDAKNYRAMAADIRKLLSEASQ